MDEDLLERASWIWSLSLIALTVAIHVLGVVMMALVLEKIRFRLGLDNRSLGLRYVIPIVIGLVGAVGLLLAVLHGIEATIWAADVLT